MQELITRTSNLLTVLFRTFSIVEREGAACCGVTIAQRCILAEIQHTSNLTVNELARRLGVDPSTVTRVVDGLVKEGLVRREANPSDRRAVMLSLSERGAELAGRLKAQAEEFVQGLLSRIPGERRQEVIENLTLFMNALLGEAQSKGLSCCGLDVERSRNS